MIAVVRIRGLCRIRKDLADTLYMMRLYNKNHAVVLEETKQNLGMIKKVKDFVAYGKIEEPLFKELIEKRGQEYVGRETDSSGKISYSRRFIEYNGKKYLKYFRLSPPKKGYGRMGIKKPFNRSGALGDRKEKINDLLKRMI